jgi:signal transduction histidine kinase
MEKLLTTAAIRKLLGESRLFHDLSEEEKDRITKFCRVTTFDSGDLIIREGDPAEQIYIVATGTVAVEVGLVGRRTVRRATIETVRRGECIGWSAGLDSGGYVASAVAVGKTSLVALNGADLSRLCEEVPHLGLRVTRKLLDLAKSRFTHTTEKMANILSVGAHDLKSPLAAIQSFNQVMLSGYAGEITDKQRNMLQRSIERIKGLVSMIDDIADLSRFESDTMEMGAVDLVQTTAASLEKVRPQADEKSISLLADLPSDLPCIPGNAARLGQAIINLLGNAVKFTENGGKVTLRITDDTRGQITGEGERVLKWVKSAIAFLKAYGKEIALAEFSSPRGRFVRDQRYLFVLDNEGTILAHGINEKYIGKNVCDLKDSDGRSIVRRILDTAKARRSGWVEYKWYDPVTREERPKAAYVQKVDEIIICSGMYQDIVVEVMDNGQGIPRDELPMIFDDFFRGVDAPAGGAGLGLSIVKRTITAHGGRIWVESPYPESKKGAKFTFSLPKRIVKPQPETKEEMSGHESRN